MQFQLDDFHDFIDIFADWPTESVLLDNCINKTDLFTIVLNTLLYTYTSQIFWQPLYFMITIRML